MTEPTYSTTTERLWKRLPAIYRNLDSHTNDYENVEPVDYPLKRFISSISDSLDDIFTLIERLNYVEPTDYYNFMLYKDELNTYERPIGIENPDYGFDLMNKTSDLLDGRTANSEWLIWLGNLYGANITNADTEAIKRDKAINGYNGFKAGSRASVGNATTSILTGTKYYAVYDHMKVVASVLTVSASEWDVTIVTRSDETPPLTDVAQLVIDRGAKAAGIKLYYLVYTSTWANFELHLTTWTLVEAQGSWDAIESLPV